MKHSYERWRSLADAADLVSACIPVIARLALDGDLSCTLGVEAISALRSVLRDIECEVDDAYSALAHYDKCQSCSMCQED